MTHSTTPVDSNASFSVRVAADTDSGLVRKHNEDAYLISNELGLYAVADGVGGHGGGVEASGLVVSQLPKFFIDALKTEPSKQTQSDSPTPNPNGAQLYKNLTDTDLQQRLCFAIKQVNSRVFDAGADMEEEGRMGATLTGALFLNSGTALIFNVGDSRTYCYRDNALNCVTKDQSWYQTWLDNGSIGAPPPKSVILQGMGLEETVVPDWVIKAWQTNDLWLMCSDGLTDRVSDEEIAQMIDTHITNNLSLVALCGNLIAAANEAGGEDNITVLALKPFSTQPDSTPISTNQPSNT